MFLVTAEILDIAVLADIQVILDLESQVFLVILGLAFRDIPAIQDQAFLVTQEHLGSVEFQVILV